MNRLERNLKLKELYRTGKYTYEQLGAKLKPPLTAERVRQIIKPTKEEFNYCKRHHCKYKKNTPCKFCTIDYNYADDPPMSYLMKRIKALRRPDRDAIYTYERKLISRLLYFKYHNSPGFIGKLLTRDLTTIQYYLGLKY